MSQDDIGALEKVIEDWMRERSFLETGEVVEIALRVTPPLKPVTVHTEGSGRRRVGKRYHATDKPITDEHWAELLTCPELEPIKPVLELLKQHDNVVLLMQMPEPFRYKIPGVPIIWSVSEANLSARLTKLHDQRKLKYRFRINSKGVGVKRSYSLVLYEL